MTGIIFIVLFFGVILFLIIIAVVGSKKDNREKKVQEYEKNLNSKLSEENYEKIYLKLYSIINNLDKQLANFKPSVGIKSMSEINNEAKNAIKKLMNSDELKNVYLIDERKEELEPLIKELNSIQPNKWKEQAFFSYNIITRKIILFDEKTKEIKDN